MLKTTSYEQYIAAIRELGELLERQRREPVSPEQIVAAMEAIDRAHALFRGEVAERVQATQNRGFPMR